MLQIAFNILFTFSIYLLIGSSFSLIYYTTKIFHLAHAAIITLGAYFALLFLNQLPISYLGAFFLAIIASVLLGLGFEIFVYRHMRRNDAPAFSYLLTSIGLYVILQNFISLFFGDDMKIINTAKVTEGNQIFGAYITTIQIMTILISTTLFIAINILLHFTSTGKSIRAIASNPELCNIYGISSNKVILIAFGFGSALAAIAGILSALDTNMTPTFGFNLLLFGLVAMIIGGVGSTRGLIVGALLVATSQHLAAYYIDTKWMDAITYVILILFLIWKPLGFSGKRLKKVEV